MKKTLDIQSILYQYQIIAGADEAGRGSWAGPIVGAAVILDKMPTDPKIRVADSKKMTPLAREKSYEWIIENAVSYEITVISNEIIDEAGLGAANIQVLEQSINNLRIKPQIALIDGFNLKNLLIPQQKIIHGDDLVPVISAASILAKVYRDRIMKKYSEEFPEYFFAQHKGYGTKLHFDMLKKYGVCPIHRRSYRPVKHLNYDLK